MAGIGKIGKFLGRGIKNYAINTAISYGVAYGISKLLQSDSVRSKINEYIGNKMGIGLDPNALLNTNSLMNQDPNKLMNGIDSATDVGNLTIDHKKLKDLGIKNINNFAESDLSSITKQLESKSKTGINNVTNKIQSEASNITNNISSNNIQTDFNKLVGNIQDQNLSSVYDSLGDYYNNKKTSVVDKVTDTKNSIVDKASEIDINKYKNMIEEKAKSGDLDVKKIANDFLNIAKERASMYKPENIKKNIEMIKNPEKMTNEIMSKVNSENPLKDFDINKVQSDMEKEIFSNDAIREINSIGGFNFNE